MKIGVIDRLRIGPGFVVVAGIFVFFLSGGGFNWFSSEEIPGNIAPEHVLNLYAIGLLDRPGKDLGSRLPEQVFAASENVVTGSQNVAAVINSQELAIKSDIEPEFIMASTKLQLPDTLLGSAGELVMLKPFYEDRLGPEDAQSGAAEISLSSVLDIETDLAPVTGKFLELVAPVPATLSPDARLNLAGENGTAFHAGNATGVQTAQRVLSDTFHSAGDLLQNWQQAREQTARNINKSTFGLFGFAYSD